MRVQTKISRIEGDDHIIRGEKLSSLVGSESFSDVIFLLLSGKKPNEKESKIFSSLLVSVIDHGAGTTSSMATRFVRSGGNEMNASVAAGILALGKYHGGAIEAAMQQFTSIVDGDQGVVKFVHQKLDRKETIFGYGHKLYKECDPRCRQLLELTKSLDYTNEYLAIATQIEEEIEKQKGKKLVLNVDGLIAALLLAMGFPKDVGNGIFIIARIPGLVAQAAEEAQEKPVRRLAESDVEFVG